jgi:formylmethanofuran dehydrogenase subunit E
MRQPAPVPIPPATKLVKGVFAEEFINIKPARDKKIVQREKKRRKELTEGHFRTQSVQLIIGQEKSIAILKICSVCNNPIQSVDSFYRSGEDYFHQPCFKNR